MNYIKDGIHLRRIGGENPIFEFQKLAISLFEEMNNNIEIDVIDTFNSLSLNNENVFQIQNEFKMPSSTWTYLINDKGFENMLSVQFTNNIGLSLGVLITWPFMLIIGLYKRIVKPYFIPNNSND